MNAFKLIFLSAAISLAVTAAYSQNPETDSWETVLETLLSDEELSSDALEEFSFMH